MEGASRAKTEGRIEDENKPVNNENRKGVGNVSTDEQARKGRPEKIPTLKPVFKKDGTVTPANSSSISDGAAALVLMRQSEAERRGLTIRARILGHASHAQEPGWFTTAPVPAMQKLMMRLNWSVEDIDLWEVNEAFAVVPMAAMAELGMAREKLNVNGGAGGLGHPSGASGARIIVPRLHAMEERGDKRGIASLCIGGGEGTAVAIERMNS